MILVSRERLCSLCLVVKLLLGSAEAYFQNTKGEGRELTLEMSAVHCTAHTHTAVTLTEAVKSLQSTSTVRAWFWKAQSPETGPTVLMTHSPCYHETKAQTK